MTANNAALVEVEAAQVEGTEVAEVTEGKKVSVTEEHQVAINQCGSVSGKIRMMISLGYSKADTARYLGKRYQHVRNVLEQDKLKKNK